jgi:DNA-directed RNA polymerase subunit H (RpoH/RPB5)
MSNKHKGSKSEGSEKTHSKDKSMDDRKDHVPTEERKSLFIIHKTEQEKTKIILSNVLLMLSNRIYLNKAGEKNKLLDFETASKNVVDKGDNTFTIKANNGETFSIRIVFQKISATGKQSIISDYIKEYGAFTKIIVANDYNNKILDFVLKQGIQIFRESMMLADLISHFYQPRFEVLTPTEAEDLKKEYNVDDSTIKKIMRNDPVSRYFGLRKGAIMRIIRPSPTAGENVDYRIVF